MFMFPAIVLERVGVDETNPEVDEKYAKFSGSDIRFAADSLPCCINSGGVSHLTPSSVWPVTILPELASAGTRLARLPVPNWFCKALCSSRTS